MACIDYYGYQPDSSSSSVAMIYILEEVSSDKHIASSNMEEVLSHALAIAVFTGICFVLLLKPCSNYMTLQVLVKKFMITGIVLVQRREIKPSK
jgi:hypothetical protein